MSRLALMVPESEYRGYKLSVKLGQILKRILAPNVFRDIQECEDGFVTVNFEDGCRGSSRYGCGSRSCPCCRSVRHKVQWMKDTEDVFRFYQASGFRVSFMRIVATFPDYLWKDAFAMPEKELRAMLIRTLDHLYSDGGRYQLFFQMANHYWKTKTPFSGPYPHLDCNLFNIAYDRLTGRYVTIQLFADTELARKYWFEEIQSHFVGFHSPDVNINFKGPRHGWKKVAQAIKYSIRPPVRDVLDYLKGHDLPKDVEWNWVSQLLNPRRKRQSYVWGGCFSNAVRKRAQLAVGFQLRSRREFERELKQVFCEHGYPGVRDFSECMTRQEVKESGLKVIRTLDDPPPWEISLV